MDFWNKALTFAETAAKRSQDIVSETAKRSKELAAEASKRSQEITIGSSTLSDIVSETAKKSKEIAEEASKKADLIKSEAIKRADQIRGLSLGKAEDNGEESGEAEFERFGVSDELREFVKGITIDTFKDFPLQDDTQVSDVPTVSNVRQDLTEFQMKHASLVLKSVKEISKLRYELCPRFMKERKFWRIYFLLVNTHVALYEKQYMEEKLKSAEQAKDEIVNEPSKAVAGPNTGTTVSNQTSKPSSSTEQDLDVFLLGDLGDSDDGPDDDDANFDDDFDKMLVVRMMRKRKYRLITGCIMAYSNYLDLEQSLHKLNASELRHDI